MIEWMKSPYGYTAIAGGHRWLIRGPLMGQKMYWLYCDTSRYTPTGNFEDAVHFISVAEGKKYVAALVDAKPRTTP